MLSSTTKRKEKGNGQDAWQTHNEGVFSAHDDNRAVYRPQQTCYNVLNMLKRVPL